MISAGLVPLIGVLLTAVISLSGQSALTDQDIARFLLTPAGLIGVLGVVCVAITAAVLEVAVMIGLLGRGERGPVKALRYGVSLLASRLPQLLAFSLGLLLRVLAIVVPFLLLIGVIAWIGLRRHDINYYLTYWPPEFLAVATMGGALALIMAWVLLRKAAGWALALPIFLTQRCPVAMAFAKAADSLPQHRRALQRDLVAWVVIRLTCTAVIAGLTGAGIALVADLAGTNLRLIAAGTLALLLIWGLANACVAAWSNGALASLLVTDAERATATRILIAPTEGTGRLPYLAVLGVAAVCIAAGLVFANGLLDRVTTQHDVTIIAHRGAAGLRPENTMAAVRKAIEDGADWIEIDVQETADGEIVVAHDSDFMKLAGVELKVWDATVADIAAIDIGSWFDPAYASERTPLLRDVLVEARGRAKVMIELKYYGHDVALEAKVAQLVEAAGMVDAVAVMSLKYPGVQKFHALRPGWRTGLLAAKAVGDLSGLDSDFLALNTGQITMRLIDEAHAKGKEVYAWTVDDPATMSRMISMGVDGLITNQPALARQVVAQRAELATGERLMLWIADWFNLGTYRLASDERDA